MWIKRHWPMLLAVLANLPSLWRGLVWVFDWGSRVDFAVTKVRDIGGIGVVIELFLNPPPWLIFPALLVGVILIMWDRRRNQSTTINGSQDLRNHPIVICPRIHCESWRLRVGSGENGLSQELWNNIFYLALQSKQNGRTIRNVSVHLHTLEAIEKCPVKDSNSFTSDIRQGEIVYFRLGRVVSTEFSGLPRGSGEPITGDEIKGYLHNIPKRFLSFEPARPASATNFSSGGGETRKVKWTFPVIITADDLPSKKIAISVDMRSQKIVVGVEKDLVPDGISFEH